MNIVENMVLRKLSQYKEIECIDIFILLHDFVLLHDNNIIYQSND